MARNLLFLQSSNRNLKIFIKIVWCMHILCEVTKRDGSRVSLPPLLRHTCKQLLLPSSVHNDYNFWVLQVADLTRLCAFSRVARFRACRGYGALRVCSALNRLDAICEVPRTGGIIVHNIMKGSETYKKGIIVHPELRAF